MFSTSPNSFVPAALTPVEATEEHEDLHIVRECILVSQLRAPDVVLVR